MLEGFFEWQRFLLNSCSSRAAPKGEKDYIKYCLGYNLDLKKGFYEKNLVNDLNAGFYLSEIDYKVGYRDNNDEFESDRRNVFISETEVLFFEKFNFGENLEKFSFDTNDVVGRDHFINESGDLNWDIAEVARIHSISRKFLNIEKFEWGFGGGPHGYGSDNSIYSYVIRNSTLIDPSFLFKRKHNWQEKLFQLSVDMLKKPESEGGFDILSPLDSYDDVRQRTIGPYDNNLFDLVTSSSRWIFDENHLIIRFNAYDIATYSSGTPQIKIEYLKLNDYFSTNFKKILKNSPKKS